jgi:hypothetical protein
VSDDRRTRGTEDVAGRGPRRERSWVPWALKAGAVVVLAVVARRRGRSGRRVDRSTDDRGVALVELVAASGDVLAEYQDAEASEAYLGTAGRWASVRPARAGAKDGCRRSRK